MDFEPQLRGAGQARKSPPRWTGYLVAALAIAVSAGFRTALDPILKEVQPFTVFMAAAALVSWRLGLGPGCLALLLGAFVGDYLFVAPRGSLLFLADPIRGLVLWLNFCGLGFLVCWVCDHSRRARDRAEETAHSLHKTQEELKKSESQLRHISDTTPALIGYVDKNLVYRFANRQYEHWFGLTQKNIVGHSVGQILGPEAAAVLSPFMKQALAGQDVRFEAEVPYRTGPRWIEGFYVPHREETQVAGIYVLIVDISSRRQAEIASRKAQEALRLGEQRLRLALEAGSIGVWSAHLDTSTVEADDRVLELFGLQGSPRILPHAVFFNRIHPEDRSQAMALFNKAVENGHLFRLEYRVVLPHGRTRWIGGIGKKTIIDGAPHVLGVNFDVSEQKAMSINLEAKVAERTASLEASLHSIEELLYTIAHDLRAPNRAMQGFAHLLLQEYWSSLDQTARGYLERISESAIRSDQLIQDILQFGRLSHVRNTRQVVDVKQALQQALLEVEPAASARGAHIKVSNHDPWPLCMGNEGLVKQIMVHLLSNAIAYVPLGRQPEISVSAEPEGDSTFLRVKDNGIGIPPDQQEQVFKPFVRLTTADQPGTGMGLAIVRKAAERMNGLAGVDSRPGQGSCFWVQLPAAFHT